MMIDKMKVNFRLVLKFAMVDMKRRFKSSILSWFWLIISPLLMIFMYWFAFSSAGDNTNDVIYYIGNNVYVYKWIAWIIIGAFMWTYCGDVIASGPNAIRTYSWMYKNFGVPIYLPSIFVNLSKFIIGFFMLIVAWLICIICNATDNDLNTQPLSLYSLEVPLMFILLFLFMMGYTYFLAPICGISRDFQNLILIFPMLLSWVSGVFLIPDISNEGSVVNIILQINPFNFLINGMRSTMLGYSDIFSPNVYAEWYSIVSFFVFLIIFWSGGYLLNRKSRKFLVDIV